MIYENTIEGRYVDLRYIDETDAENIILIRNDTNVNKFLPHLDPSPDKQKKWIKIQQGKEGDYYFGIISKAGDFLGTVRVYDIHDKQGEIGSFVSKGNGFENIEAKVLCEEFAYETLKLETLHNLVRADNKVIIRLAEYFGVEWEEHTLDENGIEWMRGINTYERAARQRKLIKGMIYK